MTHHPQETGNADTGPSAITTGLACCWGLSSAYLLVRSLLEKHDLRAAFTAFLPLVMVWATLERKRWGRLALIGLSAMTFGMFVSGSAVVVAVASHSKGGASLQNCLLIARRLFDGNPTTALSVLALALVTLLWLRRPAVVSEFEKGKSQNFHIAHRVIATSLVGCWCVATVMTPFGPGSVPTKSEKPAPASKAGQKSKQNKGLKITHRQSAL